MNMLNWLRPKPETTISRIHAAHADGDGVAALGLAERAFGRNRTFDAAMEYAVALYLAENTDKANQVLAEAKALNPQHFDQLRADTATLSAELFDAATTGRLIRSEDSDHYTDDHVVAYWNSARDEFANRSPRENANALVASIIADEIGNEIGLLQPSAVLDFGCACGLPLHNLAQRFPAISFGGVDRQTVLKNLNDKAFKAPNLTFLDGTVFEAIQAFAPGESRKMLLHVRTAIMVYPAFLARLYAMAREAGYTSVCLYEIASLGGQSQTFRDQGSGFASEVHRSTMFIHDYATALRAAGFSNVSTRRMPHGHALTKNNMLPGDTYVFIRAEI